MTRFSQRKGVTPVRSALQFEGMDDALRNALWNVILNSFGGPLNTRQADRSELWLWTRLWDRFFHMPIDDFPSVPLNRRQFVRLHFFSCNWAEAYDLVEQMSQTANSQGGILGSLSVMFVEECDAAMEREASAYRFVGFEISEMTNEQEITAVEDAMGVTHGAAAEHVSQALVLLSDRKSPDYRNSIKESISAVEAVCQQICGDDNATLGDALGRLEARTSIHPALKQGFSKIYGYTNDADGIRHAMSESTDVGFADAKFFLVACSALLTT